MRRLLSTGLLVALAILADAAAASGLSLSTPSFQTQGPTLFQGSATVLEHRTSQGPGGASLEVTGESIRIETDSVEYVQAGLVAAGTGRPRLESTTLADARLAATAVDDLTSLHATGGASIATVSSQGVRGFIPSESCRPQPVYFAGARPATCPPISSSFGLDVAATEAPSTLEGDFSILLWGWEGAAVSEGRQATFWSGQRFTSPVVAGAPAGSSQLRHVLLEVTNGHASFDLGSSPLALFSAGGQLDARHVDLAPDALDGAHVTESTMQLARDGPALRAVLAQGTVVHPDGTTTFIGPSAGNGWLPYGLAGLGVLGVAAPAGIRTRSTLKARGHVRQAHLSIGIGNYHAAARHAESALRHRSTRVEAALLGGIALIRSGDFQDAEGFISPLRDDPGADPAALAFVEACLSAAQGLAGPALLHLRRCLSLNPSYRVEAAANASLRPLLDDHLPGGAYT